MIIKKLFPTLCLLGLSSITLANNMSLLGHDHECDPATQYCVYFKADSSVTEPAIATTYSDAVVDGIRYKDSWDISLRKDQPDYVWLNVKELKQHQVTYIIHGVRSVNSKPILNCEFTIKSNDIPPGIHTLLISQQGVSYSCKQL